MGGIFGLDTGVALTNKCAFYANLIGCDTKNICDILYDHVFNASSVILGLHFENVLHTPC